MLNLVLLYRPFPTQIDLSIEWLKPQRQKDYSQHTVLLRFFFNVPNLGQRFLQALVAMAAEEPEPGRNHWSILHYSHKTTLKTKSTKRRSTLTVSLSQQELDDDLL